MLSTVFLVLGWIFLAGFCGGASAAEDDFWIEFDARGLAVSEKRLLQLGIAGAGDYNGLIDGAWGDASQRALEHYTRRVLDPADGIVRNAHIYALLEDTLAFIRQRGLAYRNFDDLELSVVLPRGEVTPDLIEGVRASRTLKAGSLIVSMGIVDYVGMAGAHENILGKTNGVVEPYAIRRNDRWITFSDDGALKRYFRSTRIGAGDNWSFVFVIDDSNSDGRLFRVITASMTPDFASIAIPAGGAISRILADGRALVARLDAEKAEASRAAPALAAPRAAEPASDPENADARIATGTAFYVNNSDLVTARHVVEGCSRLALADGSSVRVVARHPDLDLALLSSSSRSRAWLSVERTGIARLGQKVYALGYPYYGLTGTALNLTGGNVSAVTGLGDDDSSFSISAPVQPGNSGGPLLDSDAAIIGVVVAKLSGRFIADTTGSTPENINYAISGAELLAFLRQQGTLFPTTTNESFNIENGIPASIQNAVVPIICY